VFVLVVDLTLPPAYSQIPGYLAALSRCLIFEDSI
jgi:hypothetical protein